MTTATEPLQGVRGVIETTRGTAPAAATRILYPKSIALVQNVGTILPQQLWAKYVPVRNAYPGLERVGVQMTGDVTVTDWPYLMNFAAAPLLAGVVSDTSAYTWAQTPWVAGDNLKSLTLEYAPSDLLPTVGWKVSGLVMNEYSVTWSKANIGGEETGIGYSAAFMTAGGATQITANTGTLSDRTLVYAIGTNTTAYINTTASAHGVTADTKVREASFTVNNGFAYQDTFDGTNHAKAIVKSGPTIATLTIQRQFEDTTELNAYIAKTLRRVQLRTTGPLVGAATVLNLFALSFTGVPSGDPGWAWADGQLLANITLTGHYDSGLASDHAWSTVNGDSSTLS